MEHHASTILKKSVKEQYLHRKGKLIKEEGKNLKEKKINDISEEKIACINLAYANGALINALIKRTDHLNKGRLDRLTASETEINKLCQN